MVYSDLYLTAFIDRGASCRMGLDAFLIDIYINQLITILWNLTLDMYVVTRGGHDQLGLVMIPTKAIVGLMD